MKDNNCIIDEMAKVILEEPHLGGIQGFEERIAERLYAAGYSKQIVGEWKQAYNSYPRYVCTNCNHLFNNKTFKYCPNCGARMKGDEGK